MKHPSCRDLHAYWNRLRGRSAAPLRSDLDPAAMRRILGDTFILEPCGTDNYRFRLAGTRLCSVYCAEIKGRNFLDLWSEDDRRALTPVLADIQSEGVGAVIGGLANNGRGQSLRFEVAILPLRQSSAGFERMIGAFGVLDQPYWLGVHPVVAQTMLSIRVLSNRERAIPPPPATRLPTATSAFTPVRLPPLPAPPPGPADRRGRFLVLDGESVNSHGAVSGTERDPGHWDG